MPGCENIRRQPEVASHVFGAVSDMDVRVMCQGASDRTISFLVGGKVEEAVQRLHRLSSPRWNPRAIGVESKAPIARRVSASVPQLRRLRRFGAS